MALDAITVGTPGVDVIRPGAALLSALGSWLQSSNLHVDDRRVLSGVVFGTGDRW